MRPKKQTAIARRAAQASKKSMRDDLVAAYLEHDGDLDKVARDPRIDCDRKNLHHYAHQAGVDLTKLSPGDSHEV